MEAYCFLQPNPPDICIEFNQCDDLKAQAADFETIFGINAPDNFLVYNPPGIALDSTAQAAIGVQVRGIEDQINGTEAFSIARDAGIRESSLFTAQVEAIMIEEGFGIFWNEVKSTVSSEEREAQYEEFDHFPFQFLGAGSLPSVGDSSDGYYLRVILNTFDDNFLGGSGTDADILLIAQGLTFNLDYMPDAPLLIRYNDFEHGDEDVYTVGPFDSFPTSIELKNDAPDFGDLIESVWNSVVDLWDQFVDFIKGLFVNMADYVGIATFPMDDRYLRGIAVGSSRDETLRIDGGSEGVYDIFFTVHRETGNRFRVEPRTLTCIRESANDQSTNSDEPFVQIRLDDSNGDRWSNQAGPYGDVDSGESRSMAGLDFEVEFQGPGSMVIVFQIWESDNELGGDRAEMMQEFLGNDVDEENNSFFETVGEMAGADWQIDSIKIYAFSRGLTMEAGEVLNDDTNRWIDAGESQTFQLNDEGLKTREEINLETCEPTAGPSLSAKPSMSPSASASPTEIPSLAPSTTAMPSEEPTLSARPSLYPSEQPSSSLSPSVSAMPSPAAKSSKSTKPSKTTKASKRSKASRVKIRKQQ